jgi:hypothetical protein
MHVRAAGAPVCIGPAQRTGATDRHRAGIGPASGRDTARSPVAGACRGEYHRSVSAAHDYAEIERSLIASHALSEPAEAHGTLAGALCALGPYRLEDWLAEILPEGAGAGPTDPALATLYAATVSALRSQQMDFDLLIPSDDQPIEERTRALTGWCTGFLYGLGANGAADPQRLPGDLGEILRDMTEITRADVDASDSLEANESALAELVEFVRVGVQLVFDELQPMREREIPPPPVLH